MPESEDFVIVMQAQVDAVSRALTKVGNAVDMLGVKVADLGTPRGGKTFGQHFDEAAAAAGRLVLGVAGISAPLQAAQTLMAAFNREYQDWQERQDRALKAQEGIKAARIELLESMEADSDLTTNQVIERIDQIARDSGAERVILTRAMAYAMNAKADVSASDTVAAIAEYFMWNPKPDNIETALQTARGIVEIMKRAPGTTTGEAFGLLMGGMEASAVNSMGEFSKYTLGRILPRAGSPQEFNDLLAMAASVGQMAGDQTGRITSTGFIQLLSRISRATKDIPESGKTDLEKLNWTIHSDSEMAQNIRRTIMEGLDEELKLIFEEEGIQIGNAQFEAAIRRPLQALLDKTSEVYQKAAEWIASQRVPELGEVSAAHLAERKKARSGLPGMEAPDLSQRGEAASETYLGTQTENAIEAAMRAQYESYLISKGSSWLGRKQALLRFDWNALTGSGEETARWVQSQLQDDASVLRARIEEGGLEVRGSSGGSGGVSTDAAFFRPDTPAETADLIEQLKALNVLMDQLNKFLSAAPEREKRAKEAAERYRAGVVAQPVEQ